MLSLAKNSTSAVRVSRRAWEHRIHEQSRSLALTSLPSSPIQILSPSAMKSLSCERLKNCDENLLRKKLPSMSATTSLSLSRSPPCPQSNPSDRTSCAPGPSLIQLMDVSAQCMIYLQVGAEDISDDHQVGLNVVNGESEHCQVLR